MSMPIIPIGPLPMSPAGTSGNTKKIAVLVSCVVACVVLAVVVYFVTKKPNPVDCQVKWSPVGKCTVPCGEGGTQQQECNVLVNSAGSGKRCECKAGDLRSVPCEGNPACPKNANMASNVSVTSGGLSVVMIVVSAVAVAVVGVIVFFAVRAAKSKSTTAANGNGASSQANRPRSTSAQNANFNAGRTEGVQVIDVA